MKKEKKAREFKRKPQYPGGQTAMKAFLRKQLQYPSAAQAAQIEGSVLVQFTINQLGKVIHTRVISGIGYGCDEEAERVVQKLQFEADKNRGYKSKTTMKLGIHFRLPKKEKEEGLHYSYDFLPTSEGEEEDKDQSSAGSYHYTLEW